MDIWEYRWIFMKKYLHNLGVTYEELLAPLPGEEPVSEDAEQYFSTCLETLNDVLDRMEWVEKHIR